MDRYSLRLMMLALCTATWLACNGNQGGGSDDNSDDSSGAPIGTMFGTGGANGANGTGGTTDTSGSGGSGPPMVQVVCGTALCPDPASALPPQIARLIADKMPVACCDAASSTCGSSIMGGACVPTPPADPRCPAMMVGTATAPTCCATSMNLCGFYIGAVCTIFDIPTLPPQPCGATGSGGTMGMDADAGS